MKYLYAILSIAVLLSCQQEPKNPVEPQPQLTLLDSIALVYGYENWSKVNTIRYTFNVKRPDRAYFRSWSWDVRNQEVTSVNEGDTITYRRADVDSTLAVVDARFINDKYWLLVPFNLIWDQDNFTYEVEEDVTAPLSQSPYKKLSIVYGDTGGYTPGDAYDFYLNDSLIIKEWAWRPGNADEARLINRWGSPEAVGDLKLTLEHEGPDGSFQLFFTDVSVE